MVIRAIRGPLSQSGRRRIGDATRIRGYSTPPPVNGWNAKDALANMKEADAIRLDNWYPEETFVRVRNGFDAHVTGFASAIETLMSWRGLSSAKLLAAAGTAIYDATSAGAVGAAVQSGLTNTRWQHVMFSTSALNYLYLVNGADAPRYYDGTTWTAAALAGSGLTVANLIHLNAFKRRLFFVEKDTLNAWYLPVDSIAGTLTKIDLGPYSVRGGYLMAMGTLTLDGGEGIDDLAAFVTSEGEVFIFAGTDPNAITTWQLVGRFEVGAPIGRRCLLRWGADLIVITDDGFEPLSRFLVGGQTTNKAVAISDRIANAVHEAVTDFRTYYGWQAIHYPKGQQLLFNIPTGPNGSDADQYVQNPNTGAWCRFTGQNANCWEIHNDFLYFGGATAVYLADSGLDDNGSDVAAVVKPSFSYFGMRGTRKRIAMMRPIFVIDGAVELALRTNVDFEDESPAGSSTFTADSGTAWDVGDWDTAVWGTGEYVSRKWLTTYGLCDCATINMRTNVNNGSIHWVSTDWKVEPVRGAGYL